MLAEDPPAHRTPRERLTTGALGVLLVAFGAWRAVWGIDFGDGAHAVALALRVADGDVPFRDEMNLQVLGALPAVPVLWLWSTLVGNEGIVLVARLWYVCLAAGVAALVYRVLRDRLGSGGALTVAVAAVVAAPYNLLYVSYNTVPTLALVVAVVVGAVVVDRRDGVAPRGAFVAGAAAAVAVVAHPATGVGVLALVVAWGLCWRSPRVLAAAALGAAVPVVALAVWVLLVPGPESLVETVRYTLSYQELRPGTGTRLLRQVLAHGELLSRWAYVPAALLAVVATLSSVPRRVRGWLLVLLPPAAVLPSLPLLLEDGPVRVGAASGTVALVLCLALALPVGLRVLRSGPTWLRHLLGPSAALAVVGTPVMAATTTAGPRWGVMVATVAPLLAALVAGLLWVLIEDLPPRSLPDRLAPRTVSVLLVLLLLGTHSLLSFRNGPFWTLTEQIAAGPHAGLRTDRCYAEADRRLAAVVGRWVDPDGSLLSLGAPAAYLYTGARMDTNIVWLADFGPANRETVDWMERTGRFPDVVLVAGPVVDRAGGWEAMTRDDPLVGWLAAHYPPAVADDDYRVVPRDPAAAAEAEPVERGPRC